MKKSITEVQEQERCCITSLMEDVSCAEKN